MSAAADVAGSRAGLVLSKLHVPAIRDGIVRRDALLARLLEPNGPSLVSVVTPGGYGKTTLLAQWAAESPSLFAWLTVDQDDNDLALLVREIEVALAGVGAVELSGREQSRRALPARTAATRLRALVSTAPRPFVLVIDDVHELSSTASRDFLTSFLSAMPEGSHLVLAGRVEIAEVVAAARATRELLELDASDLALSAEEARAVLGCVSPDVADATADWYVRRAEGWAAGLYLLGLTRPEPRSGAGLSSDRSVSDYLWTQHLAALPDEQLEFLVLTSVLERLCGSLCDAALGRLGSAQLLVEIERASPFLVPLDRDREWYRYHDLFRAALLVALESRADASAGVRQRASDWCLANDMPEQAWAYAAAAGDTDRMGHVLVTGGLRLYRTGRFATVVSWLDAFDDGDLLARHPHVAALGSIAQALLGRPFQAERWVDAAARAAPAAPPALDGSPADAWVACAAAMICRQGPARMLEDAEAALRSLTPFSPVRGPALLSRALAARLLGDPRAETLLEEAAEGAEASGATLSAFGAHAVLALLALERGDVEAAERACSHFVPALEEGVFTEYNTLALPLVAYARTRLAAGAVDEAASLLAAAHRIRPGLTYALPHVNVQALVELARASIELHDLSTARAVLFDAGEILRHRPDLGLLGEEVDRLRRRVAGTHSAGTGELGLTAAELRLLPMLTTHLSFREIGERLFVSRNTVKTQAISIYRKLGASSRAEAVERAAELGLIDREPVSLRRITRNG